jgi:hypothetical protein
MLYVICLSVVSLNGIIMSVNLLYVMCHSTKCLSSGCHSVISHLFECCSTECHSLLSVILLKAFL